MKEFTLKVATCHYHRTIIFYLYDDSLQVTKVHMNMSLALIISTSTFLLHKTLICYFLWFLFSRKVYKFMISILNHFYLITN